MHEIGSESRLGLEALTLATDFGVADKVADAFLADPKDISEKAITSGAMAKSNIRYG